MDHTPTSTNRRTLRSIEKILLSLVIGFLVSTFWIGLHLDHEFAMEPRTNLPPVSPGLHGTVDTTVIASPSNHDQQQQQPPLSLKSNRINADDQRLWRQWKERLPDWIIHYLDWHDHVVREDLTEERWKNHNYLILRCYRRDERCGGVSDRLKPLPLILLAAARSKRVILVHWDRPFQLEHFLLPPAQGVQWSVPDWLSPHFLTYKHSLTRAQNLLSLTNSSTAQLLHVHIHDTQGGSTQYNEELGDGSFASIYHDLFRLFFEPAPPIQKLIDNKLSESNLQLGEYAVAHFRAEYGKEVARHPKLRDPNFLKNVATNAIRCAIEFQDSMNPQLQVPIYFASDNSYALQVARDLRIKNDYPIVTFDREESIPLKLDDYGNETNPTHPQDYYSTFVDLYMAGNGKCVTYGRGGFGRFASLLSFNESCSSKHVKNFFPVMCRGRPPFER